MAISAVTDAYGKGSDHNEKMRGCARVIQLMLRTWSGQWELFAFTLFGLNEAKRHFRIARTDVFLYERYAGNPIYRRYTSDTFTGHTGNSKKNTPPILLK